MVHEFDSMNHRIHLTEYPTAVHEFMSRQMDKWVERSFGDDIAMLGSTSKDCSLIWTNV
jgi:hypothetical protein